MSEQRYWEYEARVQAGIDAQEEEMSEMTPETLRKLAELLERPTKDGARLAREGMYNAADAWEADKARIEELERALYDAYQSGLDAGRSATLAAKEDR